MWQDTSAGEERVQSLRMAGRWRAACARLGAVGGVPAILDDLVVRYSEPHRRHHTLEHVAEILGHVDDLLGAGESAQDPPVIELAAWFHDAVYDPAAGDNEARSADLAIELLGGAGMDVTRVGAVAELVLSTARHVPGGPDAAVLIDADLAVLGADRQRYLRYALDIREEYRAVGDEPYRAGRGEVLHQLLDRPLLYHTGTMRRWRQDRARVNLTAELDALRHPSGHGIAADLRHAAG